MNSSELLALFEKRVGKESALQIMRDLSREMGGCTVYIPIKPPRLEIDANLTVKEICKRYGVAKKTGYRWIEARRKAKSVISG